MRNCSTELLAITNLLALVLAACGTDAGTGPATPRAPGAGAPEVQVLVSHETAEPGDTIAVGLAVLGAGSPAEGLQGYLRYASDALVYAGQAETEHLVLVNRHEAARGALRLIAVDPDGLPERIADLRFVVQRPGYRAGLRFDPEVVVDSAFTTWTSVPVRPVVRDTFPHVRPAQLTAEDWARRLDPGAAAGSVVFLVGEGTVYGDVNLSGTVTGSDVVATANVSVGNLELLPDTDRDYGIAGNVAPANEPGLGEPGDPNPPGRNADGSFSITGADVVLIANGAVGNPVPVVGQPIPGRAPLSTNRVVLGPDLTVTANRVLRADTIYEVRGTLRIAPASSDPLDETTLTLDPGVRLEFDPATNGRLVVALRGNLVAVGTRLTPIVLTCASPTPAPGCWGGVFINGFGVLNNGNTGGGGGVGFPVRDGAYGTGLYGGIQVTDSSGALRYVRIEYAGAPWPGVAEPPPALALNGVGARTRLDSLQIFRSAGDGIAVSGGTARLRNVVVTQTQRSGLSWADGWQGQAQFLAITQSQDATGDGLRGANYAPQPNAEPRSVPQLSHVTLLGPAAPSTTRGVYLADGSGLLLYNSIVQRTGAIGFDVEGTASCALAVTGELQVSGVIFFGSDENFASDPDCLDEPGFLLEPSRSNRVVDPGLLQPFRALSPDWRPATSAPAATGGLSPPADPFFVSGLPYVGAVESANPTGSNVPWYAGWTLGVAP